MSSFSLEAKVATLKQQYEAASSEKEECEAALKETDELILKLEKEREIFLEKSKKREEEEDGQWVEFQARYDDALKDKEKCEHVFKNKDEAVIKLENEKEKLMELKTNKETEEKMAEWQDRYDNAVNERDEAEFNLHKEKERLTELREIQSAYLNKREEEEDSQWEQLQQQFDAALEEKELCEVALQIKEEEILRLRMEEAELQKKQDLTSVAGGIGANSGDDSSKAEVSTITGSHHIISLVGTHRSHMMAHDDDNTSLGATTIASNASRASEYKKGLTALDKFLPTRMDERSVMSGRSKRSVTSRSVRRRDVIKPIALEEKSDIIKTAPTAVTAVEQESLVVAQIDDTAEKISPWALSNHGGALDGNDILDQSNPQCGQELALVATPENSLVVHKPNKRAPRLTNLEPVEGRAALTLGNDPPGELPSERPFIDSSAINDSSSISFMGGGGRFRNVLWVDPNNVHSEDIDFSILETYERLTSHHIRIDQSSLQQQRVDPPEDLPKNNYYPEEDTRNNKASFLRDNRRIRVATISSGYKKANFFVREDLDTRIYFHVLEDAVGYMSRRGYARMKKEDEQEWMILLGKAHNVVKVGPTKKKQRYRKGKLVMVLSKEINNNNDYEYRTNAQHTDSSQADTEHTSLGRSIRHGYKSYSEKFLAEQEAAKQNTLLQLTNGTGVDGAGHLLQLTNGETLGAVDEATLESSKDSMGSDRKGVYGGGVRYFTTNNDDDDESEDHSSDEETFEEGGGVEDGEDGEIEEIEDDESEECVEEDEEQEEMYEVEGSMGSMFSDGDTSYCKKRSVGVDSLSDSSTLSSGYPAQLERRSTYREPPNMDPIMSGDSV